MKVSSEVKRLISIGKEHKVIVERGIAPSYRSTKWGPSFFQFETAHQAPRPRQARPLRKVVARIKVPTVLPMGHALHGSTAVADLNSNNRFIIVFTAGRYIREGIMKYPSCKAYTIERSVEARRKLRRPVCVAIPLSSIQEITQTIADAGLPFLTIVPKPRCRVYVYEDEFDYKRGANGIALTNEAQDYIIHGQADVFQAPGAINQGQ